MPWLKWRKKKKPERPWDKKLKGCQCARCLGDEPWPGEKDD